MKIRKIKWQIVSYCLVLSLGLSACKKEGPTGPTGPQGLKGDKGEQGVAGSQGAPGENGSKIYSGSTVPSTSLGELGDYYFNNVTGDFYGPKTTQGWGNPTSLKGSQGVAGSQIFEGIKLPEETLGQKGDFYFHSTTADFYGPKTEEGWGVPVNLKGVKGENGTKIFSGVEIPDEKLGVEGDFYFRKSTADFYGPKTDEGWGNPVNLRGAQGATGNTGATGATGAAGSKILAGPNNPLLSEGRIGDYYLQTTTGDFYGPKTSNSWGTPISLKSTSNVNVFYSPWYETNRPFTSPSYTIIAPHLTQEIFDQGQVLVYRKSHVNVYEDYFIELLPATSSSVTGYSFRAFEGRIEINYHDLNVIVPYAIAPADTTQSFRYVLIPGGSPLASKIKFDDYEQVKNLFKIPN